MDEETVIIDTNTRNEKIKNFFIENKKRFIIIISITIILLITFFSYYEIKKKNKINLANQFNSIILDFEIRQKSETAIELKKIINKQDNTYSPLALYFLLDNNLIGSKDEINYLFDILINEIRLEKEIKNLIIYKKALFNSDFVSENELIQMLNPIINSESVWKSHALYLVGEYFYSKNEKEKAKSFFNEILTLTKVNVDIKLQSQKRINRDFSE